MTDKLIVELISNRKFRYAGKNLAIGQKFFATEAHAKILTRAKVAKFAESFNSEKITEIANTFVKSVIKEIPKEDPNDDIKDDSKDDIKKIKDRDFTNKSKKVVISKDNIIEKNSESLDSVEGQDKDNKKTDKKVNKNSRSKKS